MWIIHIGTTSTWKGKHNFYTCKSISKWCLTKKNYPLTNKKIDKPYRRVKWSWYRMPVLKPHTSGCRNFEPENWQPLLCTHWSQSENKWLYMKNMLWSTVKIVINKYSRWVNPLPVQFKSLLHGQEGCVFFSGHLNLCTCQYVWVCLAWQATFKSRTFGTLGLATG
jgi:hypothetical protein